MLFSLRLWEARVALPRLRFFWLSRPYPNKFKQHVWIFGNSKPQKTLAQPWGICNRKNSLMPLLGVNMRSFVGASMIHIRRSPNVSVPVAGHKNKTPKHQKLWESLRYCAHPREPSDVYKSSGLGAVLLQLPVSVTPCHGAFHPVRNDEIHPLSISQLCLKAITIITGSAKLLVEVDPEQNCRPKADDEDSLSRSSFFSSKINRFAKEERHFGWWFEQSNRLSCEQ